MGIHTRGLYGREEETPERQAYETLPYRQTFRILDSLSLSRDDVLVDLGSGRGRFVCCAATHAIGGVMGVEDVEVLHREAMENSARMRGPRAPISLILGKVQEFDFELGTVFYLYNPFGPETLRTVVAKLAQRLGRKPAPVRIVYVNPVHEQVIADSGCFERMTAWPPGLVSLPVSIWKSRAPASGSQPPLSQLRS